MLKEIAYGLWAKICASITPICGQVTHPKNIFPCPQYLLVLQTQFNVDIAAYTDCHIIECKYIVHFMWYISQWNNNIQNRKLKLLLWQVTKFKLLENYRKRHIYHKYLTSAPATILRPLWSTVLLTFTSLTEHKNASGYTKIKIKLCLYSGP